MNKIVMFLAASLLLCRSSKGQAFDRMLTSPPSPGPLTMDTNRMPQTYSPPIVSLQPNGMPHASTKNKKPSNMNLQKKYRGEEDSAWQEFINRPASQETKFAPKYINAKTGK